MRAIYLSTLLLALGAAAVAGHDKPSRVYDPPRLPNDRRLDKPRDYNKTTSWTPPATQQAWEARRKELREQLQVALGLWPMPEKTPLNAVIHGAIDRDDYTVEKVYFQSLPGHYVTGNLYRPKRKGETKLPGVLCPHGHWRNGRFYEANEKEVKRERDSGAEDTDAGARYPLQARCAELARLGCVVFHYDMVGYADSFQLEHRHQFHKGMTAETTLGLHSSMGLQTWNSIRALDFLCGLPDVDAHRIGVTGASGGGTQTFILCALDDRPTVAFPAVMVSMNMQGGCTCENSSLLRLGTNNVEIAALFAPKPMALSGANDWTKDIETVGLPELKKVYGFYGAADKVDAKHFSFPHNYNQRAREMMYDWFNKHLALGQKSPIKERPIKPIPPKELSVWTGGHDRPRDALTGEQHARAVHEYFEKEGRRQLDALAKTPDEYRRVVRTALRHMVHDQLPEKTATIEGTFRSLQGQGYTIHLAGLTRPDSGTELPSLGIIPKEWNGSIVVYIHQAGKAGLFTAEGKPSANVQRLLDAKLAIMSADLYLTGEWHLKDKPTPLPRHHADFPGYTYGYNRSLVAERVHDVLTLVAHARQLKRTAGKVHLLGEGLGLPALLASCLATEALDRVAVEVTAAEVEELTRHQHLPGYAKYGSGLGFAPLLPVGASVFHPKGAFASQAQAWPGVKFTDVPPTPAQLVDAIVARP